jgi:Cu2+-exporting ATPase
MMVADSRPTPTLAPAKVACAHCGQPVPPGLLAADAPRQFCCEGCRAVYEVIHSCGLESYYRLREASGETSEPAKTTAKRYSEFDDPTFTSLYVQNLPGGLCAVDLYLEGVHCSACVWLIEKLPGVCPGVSEARLSLSQSLVRIVWDPRKVTLSKAARTLDTLGYPPHPARGANHRSLRAAEDRKRLVRIGVAGAIAGNTMLLALALYAGDYSGMDRLYTQFFRWLSVVLGVVSLAWPGSVFFRGAWAAIRTRTPHLDLPIALGLGAGGIAGVFNVITGRGDIYFDSLSVLVLALLAGRFVQHRQQRRADDAVELLFSLTPTSAHRVGPAGDVLDVPIETIQIGDTVEVRAGESAPIDGRITRGSSSMDQSLLTGESRPMSVTVGDAVCAGTVNISAVLHVKVEATGQQTRVGKLMRLVEDCSRNKAPIVQFADKISGLFTLIVLALSGLTLAAWLYLEPSRAIDHAVALLIVACPCALGLATPLALAVAIGRAARRDMLIKGGDTLERLAPKAPGAIYLDKTGTITTGRTTLARWVGDESVQPLVAALESQSSHPIARALVAAIAIAPRNLPAVQAVNQSMQGGIDGIVDTRHIAVGSAAFITSLHVPIPAWASVTVDTLGREGFTPILIAVDRQIVAVAGLGDSIRPGAADAIAALKRAGWTVGILSGDHPSVVQRVAEQVGIAADEARGGVMPEEKLAIVRERMEQGPVVMVGDGVNDAAALAAATVGIAVHGGAEASLAAANIYLGRPGLAPLVELIDGSRRVMRVVRRNLAVSLAYNGLAVALAAFGLINPLIAAVLMPLSSFSVVSSSVASRPFTVRGGR